ncbi:MAG: hypothetical protein O3B95_04230 [Chloroflexi bacterium]|nr:hypothetical protein [Chloroflexota bacterium]
MNFAVPPSWAARQSGLFSDRSHLLLEEGFWHEEVRSAVKRWYVVDVETGVVTLYSQTVVEHGPGELAGMVESHGFRVIEAANDWPTGNTGLPAEFYPLVAIAN